MSIVGRFGVSTIRGSTVEVLQYILEEGEFTYVHVAKRLGDHFTAKNLE